MLLLIFFFFAALVLQPCLGKSSIEQSPERLKVTNERAAAVKEAFQFAWNGYYTYAFPDDELLPCSNTSGNSRNGWGASAVDALSTAIIMEERTIVNEILRYIRTIDYSKSLHDEQVSLFETTIRYLAGMLSGYDLLRESLLSDLADDYEDVYALLAQSETLANILSYAFDTPSGVPSNNLYINSRSTDGSTKNCLANIGSLVLEWSRLSDLTGNETYALLSQLGESHLLNRSPESEVWPGLVGTDVALVDGSFLDQIGGWGGGRDSFYEYLIKMYVYDSVRFEHYKDRWVEAADSSMAHLAGHPLARPDLTYMLEYEGNRTSNRSTHLSCFHGGNFLLGGTVLGRQDYIDFGLDLVAGCRNTYISTATGIGPEVFSWDVAELPQAQVPFYLEHGFWIVTGYYALRPEVIESYYYAYQVTGDPKYQDWAWEAFVAINAACRTDTGFAGIRDVNTPGGKRKINRQESFLFAELMKYSYMIHSSTMPWDVAADGRNRWVFNTEAHLFRVARISSPGDRS